MRVEKRSFITEDGSRLLRLTDQALSTATDPAFRARLTAMRGALCFYGVEGDELLGDACMRYTARRMPLVRELRDWNESGRPIGAEPPHRIGAVYLLGVAVKLVRAGENAGSPVLTTALEQFADAMRVLETEGGPALIAAAKAYGVTPCD
jgi:hypothetical protein